MPSKAAWRRTSSSEPGARAAAPAAAAGGLGLGSGGVDRGGRRAAEEEGGKRGGAMAGGGVEEGGGGGGGGGGVGFWFAGLGIRIWASCGGRRTREGRREGTKQGSEADGTACPVCECSGDCAKFSYFLDFFYFLILLEKCPGRYFFQ